MKRQLLIPLIAAVVCGPLASFGQSPSPAPSASASPERGGMGSLTPGERDALTAAGQKARQDPKVLAAAAEMNDAMEAVNAAMLAIDKSLGPILERVEAASSPGAGRLHLTADEREQLRAARESIEGSPEIDAWQKAAADYRETLRQAMIAADPSVAAILYKMPRTATDERHGAVTTGSAGSSARPAH